MLCVERQLCSRLADCVSPCHSSTSAKHPESSIFITGSTSIYHPYALLKAIFQSTAWCSRRRQHTSERKSEQEIDRAWQQREREKEEEKDDTCLSGSSWEIASSNWRFMSWRHGQSSSHLPTGAERQRNTAPQAHTHTRARWPHFHRALGDDYNGDSSLSRNFTEKLAITSCHLRLRSPPYWVTFKNNMKWYSQPI